MLGSVRHAARPAPAEQGVDQFVERGVDAHVLLEFIPGRLVAGIVRQLHAVRVARSTARPALRCLVLHDGQHIPFLVFKRFDAKGLQPLGGRGPSSEHGLTCSRRTDRGAADTGSPAEYETRASGEHAGACPHRVLVCLATGPVTRFRSPGVQGEPDTIHRQILTVLLAGLIGFTTACGDDESPTPTCPTVTPPAPSAVTPPPPVAPTLTDLSLLGPTWFVDNPVLEIGETVQLNLDAEYSDGSTKRVTEEAT